MHIIHVKPEQAFQSLADPLRIRIVRLLTSTGDEACLCELVDSLFEPQYKLSRHIKTLRQAGLLSAEKSGRWIYHRLVTDHPYLVTLHKVVEELNDPDRVFANDLARFQERLYLREKNGRCCVGIQNQHLRDESGNGTRG